jgi:Domain of unknown function (DUF4192)
MDPAHLDAHRRLWIDVTRRAQPGYVAAPASLLAFATWQFREGRTNVAFDWALHGHVPSVFRQSPEDSEKCPSLTITQIRGQVGDYERRS